MKHIIKFSLFEEVNPKDISFIQNMDKYFTVSFEFEIETDDKSNIKMDFSILEDEDDIDDIISSTKHEMDIRTRSEKTLVKSIIQSLVDANEDGTIKEDMVKIFNLDNYESNREREIVKFIKSAVMSQIAESDLLYMTKQTKKYLPNFIKKWSKKIDLVEDVTLDRGIEIKPKTYLVGLSEGTEMINDFYSDLEKQSYWKFTEKTGLHINIGVNDNNAEWNPIKGLLMLNDFNEGDAPPLTFKDMTWRMNSHFCGSLIPAIKSLDSKVIEKLKRSIDLNNLKETEETLNSFLTGKIKELGHKNFGFNITKLDNNYVEFRYVGGNISKELLIEKMNYFSFVVYTMTNPEYKRREYVKKLYKFIDNL